LVPAATAAYVSFLALAPLLLWMGVRRWFMGVTLSALLLVTTLAATRARHATRLGSRALLGALFASTTAIFVATTLFGPFGFAPALATINTLFFVIQLDRKWTPSTIAIGCVPIVGPAVLAALGVLPPPYRYVGGVMEILPSTVGLTAPAAPVFLL